MASSKGVSTYNRQNWEDLSFPILCETSLGPSPFVRMMNEKYGKECKICNRPFTKTEICQSCARMKNVCQTLEVRDKALGISQQLQKNDVNPTYYRRNKPCICSFWVKGECRRGEECLYRNEKIKKSPLYIGGIPDGLAESDFLNHFYQLGELFAEKAAGRTYDRLILGGHSLTVNWEAGDASPLPPVPGQPLRNSYATTSSVFSSTRNTNDASSIQKEAKPTYEGPQGVHYPSQNPQSTGSVLAAQQHEQLLGGTKNRLEKYDPVLLRLS
ncbi:unnamed protein product [Echinostoma caproni]|uniref:C3H1-type domain-containing protein n=1 Tax=Echinostoma caproni TaxID=27848 RepID=A0A183ADU7_9TREM|nr:unnamed protein product [Echinostoma caproni]